MSIKLIIFLLLFFITTKCIADTNITLQVKNNYIDTLHKNISQNIINLSNKIDHNLHNWLKNTDLNTTKTIPMQESKNKITSMDIFFQSEKFLKETEDTYIRFRIDTKFQSKESENFRIKAIAQIPLSRSRKNLKLFIENDINQDSSENITPNNTETSNSVPEIGMHYFTSKLKGIESKYSIGFRGIYPFTRVRYKKIFKNDKWIIEPIQSFKYSTKDDFEEQTHIYFDRKLKIDSLFRFELNRKTKSHVDGMDYSLGFSYYQTINQNIGINFSQSFWGNSKYKYIIEENANTITKSKVYKGISNYTTSMSLRQSICKKWFFYEIHPAINFHRQYNYRINYSINVYLDFYFGKYTKGK